MHSYPTLKSLDLPIVDNYLRFLMPSVGLGVLLTSGSMLTHAGSSQQALEEVVITAQKREQSLQDVPIAITAFDAESMRANAIVGLSEIAERTPGFVMTSVNPAEANLYIRGIGTEGLNSNAAGDGSVVMFVDGVYVGRAGGSNMDLFDLERVEVLRGPQGTLFGKNAVGGLVHLVTAKPTEDLQARLQTTIGNLNRTDIRGMVSGPISDNFFGKLAYSSRTRDGFISNETTGNKVYDENSQSVRAALRYVPDGYDLEVTISADLAQQREAGRPRTNLCDTSNAGGAHCVGINPDEFVVNSVTDGHLDRDVSGVTAEINWGTSFGTITSISAYRQAEVDFEDAFFSNPVTSSTIESINRNVEESSQFTEELRLASTAFDNRLDWVVGLYYLTEDVSRNEMLDQHFGALAPFLVGEVSFPQGVTTTSYAIFAQGSYEIVEDLTLTVGARQTWEKKEVELGAVLLSGSNPPPFTTPYNVNAEESWGEFTPKFVLDYAARDNLMLYASAARGFKSGGFQGTASTPESAVVPYDPETAWSYELGAKTQWFDNRLRVNAAAFYTDHEDLQLTELIPACCVVVGNAANAEIKGVELEFQVVPTEGLDISGSYSYLDAKFADFASGATVDNSGNTLPRSPQNKLNLAVLYQWPLATLGTASVRVDWSYQDEMFFEASNTPNEVQDSYDTLNARVALKGAGENWELALWGKNLGDELIKSHIVAFPLYGQELVMYQPPRTWGLSVSWKLN